MSLRRWLTCLLTCLLSIGSLLAMGSASMAQTAAPQYKLIGYYTYYSIYDANYLVTDIPVQQLTHIIYTYVNTSANGQCSSVDAWADTGFRYPGDKPNERIRGNFKQLGILKKSFPTLKVLMSIGGWEYSKYFSDVAATQESRIRFARSCIQFMRDNGFDGIDVDWRYPVSGGMEGNSYRPEDHDNYALLLSEFRGELDYWNVRDNKSYLLSITAPALKDLYSHFPLDQIPQYVDWINLTTYGFQGDWSTVASHEAPLFGNAKDPRGEPIRSSYNVSATVKAYIDAGVPAEKIVIGVPFYGQAWRTAKPSGLFGLYETAQGIPSGTRPGGQLYYRDIAPLLSNASYTHYFDQEAKASWLYNPDTKIAISYEDEASIKEKAAFVQANDLAGMMVWELSFDDSNHTLLTAAHDALDAKP